MAPPQRRRNATHLTIWYIYMQNIFWEIQQNEFVQILMEAIGDGIFVLDTYGHIIAWNNSMEKITGYKSWEVMGRDCTFLRFSQCFGKKCPEGFADCGIYEHGKVESTECLLHHKHGHTVSITKNARVIRKKNRSVIGVVEVVTDLTELKNTRLKMEEATRRLGELNSMHGIIGKTPIMQNVFSFIKASAASDATILIQGESGTGKELVANAIHSIGERRKMPMVTVNCSALSETLLESELFGHVKGAFTGANRDRKGRFEEADGGTLFLDEIGDISPYIQVKMLRALQQKEIERVGESRKRKIDIRIITASNKNLSDLVKDGRFREDLYYRLKVFTIHVPPLRDRKQDIPLLLNHFIAINNKHTGNNVRGVSQSAMKLMMEYHWPGNVRELGNAIEHAFVLCSGRKIDISDLPGVIKRIKDSTLKSKTFEKINKGKKSSPGKELSGQQLTDILYQCGWNKAEAARFLGVSRAFIWKYMKKWNIPLKRPEN